jgi:hypothetical protein
VGDAKSHTAKAVHDQDFFGFIKKYDAVTNPIFPDWMVTAVFYAAVHKVDAKLAMKAPPPFDHPSNHGDRNTAVSIYLPSIGKYYFFLKNKSEFARYFVYSERRISQSLISKCLGFLSQL